MTDFGTQPSRRARRGSSPRRPERHGMDRGSEAPARRRPARAAVRVESASINSILCSTLHREACSLGSQAVQWMSIHEAVILHNASRAGARRGVAESANPAQFRQGLEERRVSAGRGCAS
ncbi:Hypothetical protein AA314_07554 [Archangium gephyra]|uniref:Uncharacterized protein n=1 Tax=Archangium gephyra TaxID=48 RepID=A0AAC8QDV8_9BACT|nr:Hypothetical protein AA314_07554 [Archangium gephyra]